MPAADWDKRAAFAREYAISGNGTKAAIAAGVPDASAHAVAYKWLRNPEITGLVRQEIDARLRGLGPVAVDVLLSVMTDERIAPQTRLSAARDVLDRLGWVPPKRRDTVPIESKPLENYSNEELLQMLQNYKNAPDVDFISA